MDGWVGWGLPYYTILYYTTVLYCSQTAPQRVEKNARGRGLSLSRYVFGNVTLVLVDGRPGSGGSIEDGTAGIF